MCQGLTEFFLIGYLTESIWTPRFKFRCNDTKHQIADILTKGNFTRDEWNNLLSLFQHQPFQLSLCCAKNLSFLCHRKDGEKDARTERRRPDCGEIQANGDEPDQFCSYKFFICELFDCVEKSGILKASSRQVGLSGKLGACANQSSNADSSVELSGLAKRCSTKLFISTGKLVATGKDQKSLSRQEESCHQHRKLVATEYKGYLGNPEVPEGSEDSKPRSRMWPHHFHISPDCVLYMEKVFSIVRKINDRKRTDDLKDLDVNTVIGYIHVCHTSSCSSSWTRLFI